MRFTRNITAICFSIFLFACSQPKEKWVRSVADKDGKSTDTLDIEFYKSRIDVDFSGFNPWRSHSSFYSFNILDSAVNPGNERDIIYLVTNDTGAYYYLNFYRFEKDRMSFNFNGFVIGANFMRRHIDQMPDIRNDAMEIFADTERQFFSPMLVTESHFERMNKLRRYVSVTIDTVRDFYRMKLEFLRRNKQRIIDWGNPGPNYMMQEPEFLALEEAGFAPYQAYAQLISSGFYASSDDSIIHTLDSIYWRELRSNYYLSLHK